MDVQSSKIVEQSKPEPLLFEERYVAIEHWLQERTSRRVSFGGAALILACLFEVAAATFAWPWPIHVLAVASIVAFGWLWLGAHGFAEGYELRSLLAEVALLPKQIAEPILLRVEGLLVANAFRLPRSEMHAIRARTYVELERRGVGDSSKARAIAEAKCFLQEPVDKSGASLDPQVVAMIDGIRRLGERS